MEQVQALSKVTLFNPYHSTVSISAVFIPSFY